jgi:hypothetical protein
MSQETRRRILQPKEKVAFDFVVNDPGMTGIGEIGASATRNEVWVNDCYGD